MVIRVHEFELVLSHNGSVENSVHLTNTKSVRGGGLSLLAAWIFFWVRMNIHSLAFLHDNGHCVLRLDELQSKNTIMLSAQAHLADVKASLI